MLSAWVTVTSAPLGGAPSLAQLGMGVDGTPESCIPKVVDAPGASAPLYEALTAIAVAPVVVTVAFHADTTLWPAASVQVTAHLVAAAVEVLVTLTVTISPPYHWLSACAVALQAPASACAAGAGAGAPPARAGIISSATSVLAPTVTPATARAERLDMAMTTHPSRFATTRPRVCAALEDRARPTGQTIGTARTTRQSPVAERAVTVAVA